MQLGIEPNAVFRIRHYLLVRFEAVWHIGESILPLVKQTAQCIGIVLITDLQQFEQIDNLVVSPITDVRPRVLRLYHLPVNAVVGDTVGVIPVRRSRIEELGDDMIDKERIGERQRFPVLEYIAPVALIGHHRISLLVLHTDVKQVPRTRRITVATTESQRQIFRSRFRRIGQIIAAAHGVKQHVGEMACIIRFIAGMLYTVVFRDYLLQRLGGLFHRRFYLRDSIRLGDKMHQIMYRYRILTHVQHVVPSNGRVQNES